MALKAMLAAVLLTVSANAGASGTAQMEEIRFESQGVSLAGTLVLPTDRSPRAAVVFVHGSGPQTRNLHWAEKFAAAGIAALVYDKRGVGQSGGSYDSKQSVSGMNISLLADDAAAALNALSPPPRDEGCSHGIHRHQPGRLDGALGRAPLEAGVPGVVERSRLQGERGRHLQHLHPRSGIHGRAFVQTFALATEWIERVAQH